MNQNPKKTAKPESAKAKRAKAGNKRLNRWERLMLNPETKQKSVMVLVTEEGNVIGMSLEQYQRELAELKARGDEAVQEVINFGKRIRLKNPKMFRKRPSEAMGALLNWAVTTGWCDDGESLSPSEQMEMLECFYDEASRGIIVEQAPFRKARSRLVDKAYEIAKPYLLSFREAQGIPNNQPLTKDQGRQIWPKIIADPKWKKIVRRHAEREFKRLAFVMPRTIQDQMAASSKTLREGARNRWDDEFSGNNDR